jgi:hypothetical protein
MTRSNRSPGDVIMPPPPNGPAFSRRCPHAYCTALATRRVAGNGRLQREVGGLLVQAEEGEDGVVVATRSGRAAGRDQMRE